MNVLSEASEIVKRKWGNTRGGWKAALFIGLIILTILAVIGLSLWLVGRLIKSLTAGGFGNRDLYIPRVRKW
jgi:ascorbate-specific PTS system EIIC-type component UlaA